MTVNKTRQATLCELFDELQELRHELQGPQGTSKAARGAASRVASVGVQLAAWAEQSEEPSTLSFSLLGETKLLEARLEGSRGKTRELEALVAAKRAQLRDQRQLLDAQHREIGELEGELTALDARLLDQGDEQSSSLDSLAEREIALLLELAELRQAEQTAQAQQEARLLAELGVSMGDTVAAAELLERRDELFRMLGQLQRITPKLSLSSIKELVATLGDARGRLDKEMSALQEVPQELAAEVLGLEAAQRWREGAARGAEALAAHLEATLGTPPRARDAQPASDKHVSAAASAAEQLWRKGELDGKKRWLAAMGPLLKKVESAVTDLRGQLDKPSAG